VLSVAPSARKVSSGGEVGWCQAQLAAEGLLRCEFMQVALQPLSRVLPRDPDLRRLKRVRNSKELR
jgi:hypothetical protein